MMMHKETDNRVETLTNAREARRAKENSPTQAIVAPSNTRSISNPRIQFEGEPERSDLVADGPRRILPYGKEMNNMAK
jgi:hypothetical protein